MEYHQAMQMMKRCKEEITQLRNQISSLQPKADAYERVSQVLDLILPQQPMACQEDVLWIINREIDKLTKETEEEKVNRSFNPPTMAEQMRNTTTEAVDEDDGNTPIGIIGGVRT